jgi:hypothetical protein
MDDLYTRFHLSAKMDRHQTELRDDVVFCQEGSEISISHLKSSLSDPSARGWNRGRGLLQTSSGHRLVGWPKLFPRARSGTTGLAKAWTPVNL